MFGPGEYVSDPTEGIIDVNDLPKPIVLTFPCPGQGCQPRREIAGGP